MRDRPVAPRRGDIRALLADRNVVLGPMAGITEPPFRAICKRLGAGLTYTGMVGAKALHYNPDSRHLKLCFVNIQGNKRQ